MTKPPNVVSFPSRPIPKHQVDEALVSTAGYDEALNALAAACPGRTHDELVRAIDGRFQDTAALIEAMSSLEFRVSQTLLAAAVELDPGWTREGRHFRRLPNAEHRTPEDLLAAFVEHHHDHLSDFLPERLRRELAEQALTDEMKQAFEEKVASGELERFQTPNGETRYRVPVD